MFGTLRPLTALLAAAVFLSFATFVSKAQPLLKPDEDSQRIRAHKLFSDGNHAEAYDICRELLLLESNDGPEFATDFDNAVACLSQLNRVNEYDELVDSIAAIHDANWRFHFEAAETLIRQRVPSNGFLIAGEFERGHHRGGGKHVSSQERDRVVAIRHLLKALELQKNDIDVAERANTFGLLADAVQASQEAWELQSLTDLSTLPDYGEAVSYGFGYRRYGGSPSKGAPVDKDGNPVFIALPESWETASSDGERWRWAMMMEVEADNDRQSTNDIKWAHFLLSQFGVNDDFGGAPLFEEDEKTPQDDEGLTTDVHLLKDSETIARLATGLKRFDLPDEFNHIAILKNVIDRKDSRQKRARELLLQIRMNRHQYPQAAALLKDLRDAETNKSRKENYQQRIDQIEGNWMSFSAVRVQPADTEATFDIRYRNGAKASFTARPIKVDTFLRDTINYLQSRPKQLDHQKLQIENIGYQLLRENEEKYLGDPVAEWTEKLEPPEGHFDAVKTISTSLKSAGAYWVTGKIKGGNEARMVVWVADTAITRKRIEEGTLHFVADAVSGKPIASADLEFFGWQQKRIGRTREYQIQTKRFADRTDKNGICIPETSELDRQHQWLTVVRTNEGRLAYDGFNGVWNPQQIQPLHYSPVKVYTITDRPVYRPQHDVRFRMWVRRPRFSEDSAMYAQKSYTLQIRNPKGDVVFSKAVTTDRWAGVDGEWTIPEDATLGQYTLEIGTPRPARVQRPNRNVPPALPPLDSKQLSVLGRGHFRVEEYRKPEFEVTIDAPTDPVMLGEEISATINANYYFGAPVTEAKVHYKVERTSKDSRWYPIARWDWLYSPGYWWYGYDYAWYPGWGRWGCIAPIPFWHGWRPDPPEVVAEGDAEIGADGTFQVKFDTESAKIDHGDSDHEYKITAEVVDKSRRTITGTGNVLVARQPFRVFVWPNRGHYRTGDTIDLSFQARTADGKPVAGEGKARLLSIDYEDGKPVETAVETWEVACNEDGGGSVQMVIPKAGQYRLSVEINDGQKHTAEGAYIIFVKGADDDGRGYRFNDLELITDKRDYQPGETAKLQINTNKLNSSVLLFVRPMNGICPKPQLITLDGKSTTIDLQIARDDMPNIFVEALTIADGRIHSQQKEIVVPPEQRVANVEVQPSSDRYRPGEEATVRLKLTDVDGQPFVGDTVISVYDASLEYIAASSIPEIREFFWKTRRRHNGHHQCTLDQVSSPQYRDRETHMQILHGQGEIYGGSSFGFGGGIWGSGGGGFGPTGAYFGGNAASRGRSLMMRKSGVADEMAVPMAAPVAAMADSAMAEPGAAPGGNAEVEPSVRSNFADTAHWVASVTSDREGMVEVKFKVPDNLTTWKVKAWTLGDGTRVGSGSSDMISSKDLIIRPQTPRFFTEQDLITLSAVVHNYLDRNKSTKVVLETEGGQLQILGNAEQVVTVPADGEVRVDWNVQVVASGETKIRMKAITDEESDAAEYSVPVNVHGMLKTESFTGVIRPQEQTATVQISVPAQRIEEQSRLEVRFSPTLAGAMVDALPYLIEYPYGCTEQTLNRFLPAAITQKTLQRMGIDLEDVQEKRTNLNAQELGDAAERAAQWKRYHRNPVFDEAELAKIVKTGVTDLTNMQLTDGGWGWFSGYGEHSTAHLTSLVVHGLTVAQKNDVPVLPDVIQRGVAWLKNYQAKELEKLREADWRKANPKKLEKRRRKYKTSADNMDAFVAWVLIEHDANDPAMTDYLYRDRQNLSVYSKALTGMILHEQQDSERRDMVLRNIEQTLVEDDENQTAYLRMPQRSWWYWYGSENEAMARYLQLLLKVNPKHPVAPKLVKYLLNNRKHGTYWKSTRDTAMVVEAMADYLAATEEDKPDMTVEVLVDGVLQKKVRITADNLFSFDNVMLLAGDTVKTGNHTIELRRTGKGPVYFNAYLTNFTKEDHIMGTGLEVKVSRRFYRLERDDREVEVQGNRGHVVSQQTVNYRRIPIDNLGSVTSGDLIEVEMVVESKNDYEYLLLEDRKPSGFETDDQRSGYIFEGLRAYRELRDDRVSFFLSNLARGRHSVSYRIRAETPSRKVSALPAKIEGMYAPELVGNSDEFKLSVRDSE